MFGTPRRAAIAVAWFWILLTPSGRPLALAQSPSDPAVLPASLTSGMERVPPRKKSPDGGPAPGGPSAGWWFGPVGIAAALAVVGGISLASKRFHLNLGLGMVRDPGSIGVVGQTRLSPKHAVYLVRVGDRVLIVGAGQGGSPTTLGEVTDSTELDRLVPHRTRRPGVAVAVPVAGRPRTTGFDQRIGDDE